MLNEELKQQFLPSTSAPWGIRWFLLKNERDEIEVSPPTYSRA